MVSVPKRFFHSRHFLTRVGIKKAPQLIAVKKNLKYDQPKRKVTLGSAVKIFISYFFAYGRHMDVSWTKVHELFTWTFHEPYLAISAFIYHSYILHGSPCIFQEEFMDSSWKRIFPSISQFLYSWNLHGSMMGSWTYHVHSMAFMNGS